MRVHELEEAFGLSKTEVKTALKLAGLKTHHRTKLSPKDLQEFQVAAEFEAFDMDSPSSEEMPAEDRFPMVDMGGEFRESLLLPPGLSGALREELNGSQLADAVILLDRREFVGITWPDMRKVRIRIDG